MPVELTDEVKAYLDTEVNRRVKAALAHIDRAPRPLRIFAFENSLEYGKKVANHLGLEVSPMEETIHSDGEVYCKPEGGLKGNVRGHIVVIVYSLYADKDESINDKFVKLCQMAGACSQASAHEVIILCPHLAYQRQDRKTASRAPIMTKIRARMLEAAVTNKFCNLRCIFFDVHNLAAEQNAFDAPIDELSIRPLVADYLASKLDPEQPIVVGSPDGGGLKRADLIRNALSKKLRQTHGKPFDIPLGFYDKIRISATKTKGGRFSIPVRGCQTIMVDDMISTGGTMKDACKCVESEDNGGVISGIVATHGLFVGDANEHLREINAPILVADSVEPFRLDPEHLEKVTVLDTTELSANAIHRIHTGYGSISELLS